MIERPAILEWIEINWPTPPALRADDDGKAVVRAMLACGAAAAAHPAFVAARPAKQLDAPR